MDSTYFAKLRTFSGLCFLMIRFFPTKKVKILFSDDKAQLDC